MVEGNGLGGDAREKVDLLWLAATGQSFWRILVAGEGWVTIQRICGHRLDALILGHHKSSA